MSKTRFNLLTEPLIGVRLPNNTKGDLSLPGVLEKLSNDDISSFNRLQPHQFHAWHAFLVQLSALALHQAGRDNPEGVSEKDWRDMLRELTSDCSGDESWCLCIEELSKPAFMQPPVPENSLKDFKGPEDSPDSLSVLIRSKNHDIKSTKILNPEPDNWIYELVTLQTMQGFLGAGNYGIARMNGGFSSRSCVTYIPGINSSPRYIRDVNILLSERNNIIETFEYKAENGNALLWTIPWDGKKSLSLSDCDPFFIEICRRIRLKETNDNLVVYLKASKKARIESKEQKGRTGDPWTPISTKKEAAFTADSSGFTYKRIQQLLFSEDFIPALTQKVKDGDPPNLEFLAQAMVRGQGVTEGLYERRLPIPEKVKLTLRKTEEAQKIAQIAKDRISTVETVQRKILKPAILTLIQGAPDKLDFKSNHAAPWLKELDDSVDHIFFERLWKALDMDKEEASIKWQQEVVDMARTELEKAEKSVPMPNARYYRVITTAERTFNGSAKKNFPDLYNNNQGGKNGIEQSVRTETIA